MRVTNRRAVIAGLGAAMLLPRATAAQSKNPRRIDVHHHTVPPHLLGRIRDNLVASSPYGSEVVKWTPAASLEQMDRYGIATAILSNTTAWACFKEDGPTLCRATNDYAAQLRAEHAGRFGLFAAVPMP